ncbi:hypothetical protein CLOM_g15499 [Closterium sp. NIES-68]|nr:hypothetical protein CLOM_g6465 [Closterium sp. NIES-68]GJP56434.1 hypothetical protein CLOM_g15499 [Closterium sp. NIES-68]GJP69749.1 hypothetical protein CLOP_g764 [Closterium sp. NIES-67]
MAGPRAARSRAPSSIVLLLLLLGSFLLAAPTPTAANGAQRALFRSQGIESSRSIARTIWRSGSGLLRGNSNGQRSGTGSTSSPGSSIQSARSTAAATSSSGCQASSLDGFTSSVALGSSGLTLHWRAVTSSQLAFALEAAAGSAAAAGWFSVGWSSTGRMAGSDAVVGNLAGGGVKAVYMSGTGQSDVQPTSSFDIGNAQLATSASGSTVLRYALVSGSTARRATGRCL